MNSSNKNGLSSESSATASSAEQPTSLQRNEMIQDKPLWFTGLIAQCKIILASHLLEAKYELGKRIKEEFDYHKYDRLSPNQEDLANALGVSRQAIGQWILFYEKIEGEFANSVSKFLEEKGSPSWHKIVQDFLPKHKHRQALPEAIEIPDSIKVRLIQGDFRQIGVLLEPNSIDLILTDPPYEKDFLPQFDNLGKIATDILKPGGWFVAYVGKMYLPQVLSSLSNHLDYYWTICIQLPNGHHNMFDFDENWRPVIIFNKPPRVRMTRMTSDVLVNPEPNKDLHEWGQGLPPFLELVELFSKPNASIFEPCAGGGTTIQACIERKRNVVACEISPEIFTLLKERFPNANSEIL